MRKWEKQTIGKKNDIDPRPDMGKNGTKNGKKGDLGSSFVYIFTVLAIFSRFGPWAIFFCWPMFFFVFPFSYFGSPFNATLPDSQAETVSFRKTTTNRRLGQRSGNHRSKVQSMLNKRTTLPLGPGTGK